MALRPSMRAGELVLVGNLDFTVNDEVTDSFRLEIILGTDFPKSVPRVTEIGARIPREGEFHINPDKTLCLGSPLRLHLVAAECVDFNKFAEKAIVPFLYGAARKLRDGGRFVNGELAHGNPGVIADYQELLGLDNPLRVVFALRYLATRRRHANKLVCPCGCKRRLGRCELHHRLNRLRALKPRSWYARHAKELETSLVG